MVKNGFRTVRKRGPDQLPVRTMPSHSLNAFRFFGTLPNGKSFYVARSGLHVITPENEGAVTITPSGTSSLRVNCDTDFIVMVDEAYFAASDGEEHGVELWASDGTTEGTFRVADINPGPEASDPFDFVALNDQTLIFTDQHHEYEREVWITQGTNTTTSLLKDIWSGRLSSNPVELLLFSDRVYSKA